MIDKTKIIELIESHSKNKYDINDIRNLIVGYCVEHGKDENLSHTLFQLLLNMDYLLRSCIQTALNYYAVKYEVVKLIDSKNNIIKIN